HRAVLEERVAVARDRVRELLADQVVGQELVEAVRLAVEDVEHVLAVRALDSALELEALVVAIEALRLAALEVVAAGEDDAVVLGEPQARLADGVDARHAVRPRVEDEVAVRLLAVGEDLEEVEAADLRPRDGRVVE